jgi:hypothetical protein
MSVGGVSPGNCQKCGAPVDTGVKFCTKCGASVEQTAAAGAHYCPGCGTGIAAGTKFCPKCGRPLAGAGQAQGGFTGGGFGAGTTSAPLSTTDLTNLNYAGPDAEWYWGLRFAIPGWLLALVGIPFGQNPGTFMFALIMGLLGGWIMVPIGMGFHAVDYQKRQNTIAAMSVGLQVLFGLVLIWRLGMIAVLTWIFLDCVAIAGVWYYLSQVRKH